MIEVTVGKEDMVDPAGFFPERGQDVTRIDDHTFIKQKAGRIF